MFQKKKNTSEQYETSRRILTWLLINMYCFLTDVPLLFSARVCIQSHIWRGRMTVEEEPRGGGGGGKEVNLIMVKSKQKRTKI